MTQDDMPPGQGQRGGPMRGPRRILALARRHAAGLITVALFLAGSYALHRLLAPLDLAEVAATIRAKPGGVIAAAILATGIGYAALVGYDWTALRYLRKSLPFPTIALGGFLGYALGNTIGLSAVSGGAVRYRIYSAFGLNAYDVAAVSSFAALAYGIGATLIGLGALVLQPTALDGLTMLPHEHVRIGAIAGLVATIALLVLMSLRGWTLSIGKFRLSAPSLVDLGRQMAFTFVDICMAALVVYVLLPQGALSYPNLLAIYAIATMVGVLSHVPGGVGVFESVMIAALPSGIATNEAVAALLLYRLIYFLLPFLVALVVLSLFELWVGAGRRMPLLPGLSQVIETGLSYIPAAAGFLVLVAGTAMILAGILPDPQAIAAEFETVLPLALLEGGSGVSLMLGLLTVALSIGVFARRRSAFRVVLVLLWAGLLVAVFRGHDPIRAMFFLGAILILVPCRHQFTLQRRGAG